MVTDLEYVTKIYSFEIKLKWHFNFRSPAFLFGFEIWAELRQASVKSPANGQVSSAYALLTVENQTKNPST